MGNKLKKLPLAFQKGYYVNSIVEIGKNKFALLTNNGILIVNTKYMMIMKMIPKLKESDRFTYSL